MNSPARRSFFHPASGAAILSMDWLFFGLEWTAGPFSIVLMSVFAFVSTFVAVWNIQTRLAGDRPKLAAAKAVFGAAAAGVPFPIAGTAVGALILALSGMQGMMGKPK